MDLTAAGRVRSSERLADESTQTRVLGPTIVLFVQ
jgi:hypothetical protein